MTFQPKPRYPLSEQLTRYRETADLLKQAARQMEGVNGDLCHDIYALAREAQAETDRIEPHEATSGRDYDRWASKASAEEIAASLPPPPGSVGHIQQMTGTF